MNNTATKQTTADDPIADDAIAHDPIGGDAISVEVIETPEGLPGFTTARHWVMERQAPDAVFGLLRNLDQPGIGLLIAEPWDLAPGYEPDLPDDELARIDVREPSDVTIHVVATIASGTADVERGTVWLNLAAPIVLNTRTGQARQVILDRQGWPLRHPVSMKG
ncbi:MAG TPA: flagellar assembly protein FliW [Ilumatobacteraceae bacterium]|jgi:flagellar assembly factor FliW